MTHIDQHVPGNFCWFELATTDQAAAKRFYESLLEWTSADTPIGPDEIYTIFKIDGRDVAAAYTTRPDQRAQGVPPHWLLYIAVDSADDVATKAAKLGGKVLAAPFNVMEAGRMAVLQDPDGAVFAVWEARQHPGTGIHDVPGTACWADLSTPDQARAGQFYSDLFGWKMVAGKDMRAASPNQYHHIVNGTQFIGGIPPAQYRDPHTPPHWLIYFLVSDCDASTASATALGAHTLMEPATVGDTGRFSVLADPQGAVFALFQAGPGAA